MPAPAGSGRRHAAKRPAGAGMARWLLRRARPLRPAAAGRIPPPPDGGKARSWTVRGARLADVARCGQDGPIER